MKPPTVSIIMPALNEAAGIGAVLERLPEAVREVIVADGGSRDDTVDIARRHGCRTVVSPPGRGGQQNAGAAVATGDVLLFVHADTTLPDGAVEMIRAALSDPGVIGGGFRLGIASDDAFLGLIARSANLRSRVFGIFYGDQAIFVRAEVFRRIGGFRDIPLMEDLALSRVLRRHGRMVLLSGRVSTSARRWERENPLYSTFRNGLFVLLFAAGVSPRRLADWYRH